jgi:hypothetical protein
MQHHPNVLWAAVALEAQPHDRAGRLFGQVTKSARENSSAGRPLTARAAARARAAGFVRDPDTASFWC